MATTVYFDETVKDQGGELTMNIEFGRSSYYAEDSIYLNVNDQGIIMDRATAKRFVEQIEALGRYLALG